MVQMCRAISGVAQVRSVHARRVMAGAEARFGITLLKRAYQQFARGGLDALVADAELAGLCRSVAYCLYTGLLPDATGNEVVRGSHNKPPVQSEEDYFESVLWRAIYAHPPALTGGYFGHWHYPPEDLDADEI